MTDSEITVLANSLGLGYFAFLAGLAIWLRASGQIERVHESAKWAIVPAACWYLHRTLWNLAITTDTAATPGPYALWALETRHWWTVALFALAVLGGWRVVRPWLANARRTAGWLLIASIAVHGALWYVAVRLTH